MKIKVCITYVKAYKLNQVHRALTFSAMPRVCVQRHSVI